MKKYNTTRAALIAVTGLLIPVAGQGAVSTLPVTGWTQDMIINNGSANYSESITGTMDSTATSIDGGTFFATGTYPVQPDSTPTLLNGLNTGTYVSAAGTGSSFQFQDFSANNSIILGGNTSSTLTLNTPSSMSLLALFGSSTNGPTNATVTVSFTDGSSSAYVLTSGTGITADWYSNGSVTAALNIGAVASNHSEDTYASIFYLPDSRISIYESDITLTPADQAKIVNSVNIANTGSGGGIAVYAISSDAVPEASTVALLGACGALGLLRRRRSA